MKAIGGLRLVTGATVVAALAALVAAVLVAVPATATTSTSKSPRVSAARSGLAWPSGVYLPTRDPYYYNVFGYWRGASPDVAALYSFRDTWSEIVTPTWLYTQWKTTPETIVLSEAPFPDQSGTSLAACARGSYDAKWKQFGTGMAKAGLAAKTIVRLGWEFNGNWNPWAAKNPSDFVGCWRHVFKAAESTAPALRWDWTVNRGVATALADARKAWPGNGYVDIVGIDSYDGYPPVTTEAGWQKQYAGDFGLKFWADFAVQHGKQLSVSEWGLYPGTGWAGHNGGDNPLYISKMFGFFHELGKNLAYEAYFNEDAAYQAGALQLNPIGGAEYRRQIIKARAAAK